MRRGLHIRRARRIRTIDWVPLPEMPRLDFAAIREELIQRVWQSLGINTSLDEKSEAAP